MTKHEIIKTIDSVKKGTFVRIVYQSELPLTAAAKKAGHVIVKHTEKVVRLGVNYGNIAKVQEAEAARTEPKREYTPWCHWEIQDILAKHNTKDDYYLSFATVDGMGHHTKSTYFMNGETATINEVRDSAYVLPSYFKNNGEAPVVQKVNINNIIELGGHRV